VLQVRFNLITADPLRLGDSLKFIEAEVRPVVESLPGSLGISLYANPELGVAIVESFWASRVALVQSEEMVSPGRQEAVRRAGGTVAVGAKVARRSRCGVRVTETQRCGSPRWPLPELRRLRRSRRPPRSGSGRARRAWRCDRPPRR
jgi:hypothetical protein